MSRWMWILWRCCEGPGREGNKANKGDATGSHMDVLQKVHVWDRDPGWVRSMAPLGEDRLDVAFAPVGRQSSRRPHARSYQSASAPR